MAEIYHGLQEMQEIQMGHRFLLQSTSPFDPGNPQKRIVTIITLFFSCVALIASIMILILIRRLRVWNPQTSLIWWMSVCQCTYDASFFSFVAQASGTTSHWTYYTASFFQLFGGVSVTLFTNVITAVLMWVIISRRNVDIFRYFHWVLLITLGPAFAIGFAYLANRNDNEYLGAVLSPAYYWTRLSSIFLNLIFYLITQDRVNKITNSRTSTGAGKKLSTQDAIATLTRRSKYYWIVQAISRSGAAVYEGAYGYHGYTGFSNTNQYVGALFFAVLTPSAAIGYLGIFLYMQPRAYNSFMSLMLEEIPDFLMCRVARADAEAAARESNISYPSHENSKYASKDSLSTNSVIEPKSPTESFSSSVKSSITFSSQSESSKGVDIPGRTSDSRSIGASADNRPLPPIKSPVISPNQLQTPYPPGNVSPSSTSTNGSVPGGWRSAIQRSLGSDLVATAAKFGCDSASSVGAGGGMGLRRNFGSGNIQDLNLLEDDDLFDIIQNNEQGDMLSELSKSGNPVHGGASGTVSMSSAGGVSSARQSTMSEQSRQSYDSSFGLDEYDFEYMDSTNPSSM